MNEKDKQKLSSENNNYTIATNASRYRTPKGKINPLSVPIYASSTFMLDSVMHGALLSQAEHSVKQEGWLYSRWNNPTVEVAERIISELENGYGALLTSSGMAAIILLLFTFLNPGDQLIAPQAVYGGTHEFLKRYGKKFGINVEFVDATDVSNIENAITKNTKLILTESPTNPTMRLTDLKSVSMIAKKHNILVAVDSTFASPINIQPIKLGIDIVIHSATKYLGGHTDIIGGTLIFSSEELYEAAWNARKLMGNTMSPFDAYLLIRGMKTLDIRIKQHNENALKIAEFLYTHPKILKVHYPGLPSHPDHQLAKQQMKGFGGMMSFEVKGGLEAGKRLVEGLHLINLAVSLGGVESLIEHPATMTHSMVSKEDREKAAVTDGLIRFSVGIEDSNDLIGDLSQALEKI